MTAASRSLSSPPCSWLHWAGVAAWTCSRVLAFADADLEIRVAPDATPLERHAAAEIRRYTYLRTGELPGIRTSTKPADHDAIWVGRADRETLRARLGAPVEPGTLRLLTRTERGHRNVLVAGGDDLATLHAAYRYAEHLGVRFYLHGDVLPDNRLALPLPDLDETLRPLFALRGIQPFHDFPEGPDWWNDEDYRAVISQLPKLRMNFIALHTYPEARPNAEPTVWIGPPDDFDASGRVRASYAASYQNTLRGNWGYRAKPTSSFSHGTAGLFNDDAFGADVMRGFCPEPTSAAEQNALFDRTADLLRSAFTHARHLGVKTCVGTETPLVVPRQLAQRLETAGLPPDSLTTRQRLYAGTFARAAAAYPLDYFWLWTPENWTWEGTQESQVKATIDDLQAAIAAHRSVQPPFQLATCGWVLGPSQDRALFDKVLPPDVAVSCINREVGRTPVEAGFRDIRGRGKWAIPWLEDDPALTSPQLWVGRMRRDAADAREFGCDGLLGIHWRTRILGPAVAALAQAAWTQEPWLDDLRQRRSQPAPAGPWGSVEGGQAAAFPGHAIADTDDDAVYRTVRYNLSAYRLVAPNGPCRVTLRFCEPHYHAAGKRVFDVRINGQPIVEALDIFARVGADRALDVTADAVSVTNGMVEISFLPRVEYPSLAGLSLEWSGGARHIDCGGPGTAKFLADLAAAPSPRDAMADTRDFYLDWARAEFGPEVAAPAAAVFSRIDGHLPRPSDWTDGPGGLKPDPRPWKDVQAEYAFVEELARLRTDVRGPGQTTRLEWWVETFRYARAMAELNCRWAETQATLATAAAPSPDLLFRLRRELVRATGEVYRHLLATLSNPGELGTLANWEQHILPAVFADLDQALGRINGTPVPDDARLPTAYSGPSRLIVPTAPTSVHAGTAYTVRLMVLGSAPPRGVEVFQRRLGGTRYERIPVHAQPRGPFVAGWLPPRRGSEDFEWYAELTDADGRRVRWPATAPAVGQTVVVEPAW